MKLEFGKKTGSPLQPSSVPLCSGVSAAPAPTNLHRPLNMKLTTAQDLHIRECIQDECYRTLKHVCATSLYETVPQFKPCALYPRGGKRDGERASKPKHKLVFSTLLLKCLMAARALQLTMGRGRGHMRNTAIHHAAAARPPFHCHGRDRHSISQMDRKEEENDLRPR